MPDQVRQGNNRKRGSVRTRRSKKPVTKTLLSLAKFCLKAVRAFWQLVFEFWKTLPETVKKSALVFVLGVLTVALSPSWSWIRNGTSQNNNQPVSTCPPDARPDADSPTTPPTSRTPPSVRRTRADSYKANYSKAESARIVPNHLPADESLAVAQQTLQRGNYAEAYRIYKAALPKRGQTNLPKPAQDALDSYGRGDFREAAYQMRQAFQHQ
jgi:hypothetical protein